MKYLTASILYLFCVPAMAQSLEEYLQLIPHEGPIVDWAEILSDYQEDELAQLMESDTRGGVEYALVTVPLPLEMEPLALADQLRQAWEVGGDEGKNGLLILITTHAKANAVYLSAGEEVKHGLSEKNLAGIQKKYLEYDIQRGAIYAGLKSGIKMLKASYHDYEKGTRRTWLWIGGTFVIMTLAGIGMLRRGMTVSQYGGISQKNIRGPLW